MDAQTIEDRIFSGRAKAALRIGYECRVFRPLSASAPLANQVTITYAAFNAADSKYLKPNLYGKAVWFADLDGRLTKPGDYLVRIKDGATWFIAAQQSLLPIVAVECPRSLVIEREPAPSSQVGIGPYGGLTNLTDIAGANGTYWPASILSGGKRQQMTALPSDVEEAGWVILLPPSMPEKIEAGDIVLDDLGRRFAVGGAELTDLGWRLICNETHV